MTATTQELIERLEAARAAYAEACCDGDISKAYTKIAEITLGLRPKFGTVKLEKLSLESELTARVLEKVGQLTAAGPPPAAAAALPISVPRSVLNLRVTRGNGVIPDEENVRRILSGDPNLQGIVRYDEFSGDMMLTRPITADRSIVAERGIPRPWADADTVTLQTYIQRHIVPRMGREKIEAVVAMHARHNCAFHPVRDYLQSVSWDSVPRLNTWLRNYFGANDQPEKYLAAVGAAWLISAVARIFEPGCQVDSALVLEGAQGIRKSTALRVLAGDAYFSDSLSADLSHKDARDHLRGKWIIELAELAQFKRAEIETVKQFITRRFEQYRPSYGRHEVKFPRQCVFAGSTNDETYLVDTTGNRRFWVVACSRIEIDAIKGDRDQLWAEAVTRFRAGERWYLTDELEALAAGEAQLRVAHDPWTAKVAEIVVRQELPTPDVAPGEVMVRMDLHQSERHARNAGRIGQILKDLGWRKGRRDKTRGQTYTPPLGQSRVDAAEHHRAQDEAFAAPEDFPPTVPSALTAEPALPAPVARAPTPAAAQPEPAKSNGHDAGAPRDEQLRKMLMGGLRDPKQRDSETVLQRMVNALVERRYATFKQVLDASVPELMELTKIHVDPQQRKRLIEELQRRARIALTQESQSHKPTANGGSRHAQPDT
jgi:predicted P-loop ATPase